MTTYSTAQIKQFLIDNNREYASIRWSEDMTKERVTYMEASNWFQKYFMDRNVGQYLFRLMECECVGYITELK